MRRDKLDNPPPAEAMHVTRRSLLFGLVATGAFALPLLSNSTQAAVSMLRSGIDPDAVQGEVIPARRVAREAGGAAEGVTAAGIRGAGEAKAMGAAIRGAATARAEVVFTTITIMGGVVMATVAITSDMAGAATIPGTAGVIGIAALAGSKEAVRD
jgi:hypothetical protein